MKGRKEIDNRKEKIEFIWTDRRQLIIIAHGKCLDKKTEKSGDDIEYRMKLTVIMIIIKISIISHIFAAHKGALYA